MMMKDEFDAVSNHVSACTDAGVAVTAALTRLSEILCEGHLPAVTQAAHANLILSASSHHAAHANAMGWGIATVTDTGPTSSTTSTNTSSTSKHVTNGSTTSSPTGCSPPPPYPTPLN